MAETAANVYIQDLAELDVQLPVLSVYRFYPFFAIEVSTVAYT